MSLDSSISTWTRPLREGEFVLLLDTRGRRHLVRLQRGHSSHHARIGLVEHDRLIGQPPGVRLLNDEEEFFCLRPTLQDYIMKRLKRHTQIIYPKDLGWLLLQGDLFPGARVLEAGMGAGSATLWLLRVLGPDGELISYEQREDFAERTQRTIEEVRSLYGGFCARHRVRLRDVYQGIEDQELDLILLDVPSPELVLDSAARALRPGGGLLSWVPTALQIYRTVRQLQDSPHWADIEVTETLLRHWKVGPNSVRPRERMVGHTGFLIRSRRVCPPQENREAQEP